MKERLTYIDIARAICIVLVVIGHYLPQGSPVWYTTLRDIIYAFHMPLFMYLSGYVYRRYRRPERYRHFITKKFKRLMIPYFVVSLLIIGIKLIVERDMYVQNPVSWASLYQMFYLPSAGFFLWFVYVLFLIFLLIPFFDTERKVKLLLGASLLLAVCPVEFPALFCLEQFRAHLFFFAWGCYAGQGEAWEKRIRIPGWAGVLLFASLFFVHSTATFATMPFVRELIAMGLALTGIAFILALSRWIDHRTGRGKRLLLQLSVYSFTIYLLHTTFQGLAKALLFKLPLLPWGETGTFLWAIVVVNAIGILGPIVCYRLDTRRKITRYL